MATTFGFGSSPSPPSAPPDWLAVLGEVGIASHVLSALGMADVAQLRLVCKPCAHAVREHTWDDDDTGDIDSAGAFALPPVSVGAGFVRWRRCFPRATAVSLVRSRERVINDADLAALESFTSVRLHWHHRSDADYGQGELSAAGTRHLRAARRLHFRRVTFVDGALAQLAGARELYFEHCRGLNAEAARGQPLAARMVVFRYSDAADDVGDALLRLLPDVECLELSFVHGATGAAFREMTRLRTLRLHQLPRLTAAAFAGLAEVPGLSELFFIEEQGQPPIMSDALLSRLAGLHQLTLWTTAPGFTGAGLAALPLLRRTTLLWCVGLTDDALAGLGGVTALSLCCCHGVTGRTLAALPALEELSVDWCAGFDVAAAFADAGNGSGGRCWWPSLRRLELRVKATAEDATRAALAAALVAPRGGDLARSAAHDSVTFMWTGGAAVAAALTGDHHGAVIPLDVNVGAGVGVGEGRAHADAKGADAVPHAPAAAAPVPVGADDGDRDVDDDAQFVVDIPPRPAAGPGCCGAGGAVFPPSRRGCVTQ